MRILITGARGSMPVALIPRLAANGHEMVLLDVEPMDSRDHKCIQADIRDAGAVQFAMQGCGAVFHAAALDADMLGRRNHDDYHGVNVTGTQNVLLAMLRAGVKHLVFSSSDAVYGAGVREHRTVNEKTPRVPLNVYALSKMLAEEMCDFYARQYGFHIAMLRYGRYSVGDWKTVGVSRLTTGLDREDAAQANELALGAVLAEEFRCEPFLVQCAKPFVEDDWPGLVEDPQSVLERYWPGSVELLLLHGLMVPKVYHRWDIHRAETVLGYAPEHNFDQFLARLRREPLL